ncbi:MAG: SMC-Scp complex subunit ScpB [Chlorobium sp.]|nr:SMC-Scp complex subunit ScpB [Chlorobium sp.]
MQQQIEAVIFASEEAATLSLIRQVTGAELTAGQLDALVGELNAGYALAGLSFRIHRIASGYRFLAEPQFGDLLKSLLAPRIRRKLSQPVLEVLSVIAYRQPVTKGEIQQLRGTSPDYAVDRLLERGFITVCGRADSPGRPLQYGTTSEFLDLFGLHSLRDLPQLREIREILQEHEEQEYLAGGSPAPQSGFEHNEG